MAIAAVGCVSQWMSVSAVHKSPTVTSVTRSPTKRDKGLATPIA